MKRQICFWTGLNVLVALLFTGAAQIVAQDDVGSGGWQLERVLGRGAIEDLTISPDGSALAVAGSRGVWLYSLPELKLQAHLDANWTIRAAWSPDGERIATVNGSFVRTLEEAALIPPALSALSPLDVKHPSFKNIQPVRVWDAASGAMLRSLEDSHSTRHVAWTHTGGPLLGSDFDGTLRLWDLEAGETRVLDEGRTGLLPHEFFSPDGLHIARVSSGIAVRATKTGEQRFSDEISLSPYTRSDDNLVSWSPDSRRLAGGGPGDWRVWDVPAGRLLFTRPVDQVPLLTWSPDAERLALRENWSELRLLDAAGGDVLLELDHEHSIQGLAWSPDGQQLAVAQGDGTLLLRDAVTGITRLTLKHADAFHQDAPGLLWTPDTSLLVTRTRSGDIRVWDTVSGKELSRRREHGAWTHKFSRLHLSWWPDGNQVYAGGSTWDLTKGQESPAAKQAVDSLLSPDGARLARYVWEAVEIDDVATGSTLYKLPLANPIAAIAWSPDALQLAIMSTCAANGQVLVYVWDLSAEPVAIDWFIDDTGCSGRPTISWSPEGHMLTTNGSTGKVGDRETLATLRIRDIRKREPVVVLVTDKRFMNGAAWSPDGAGVASGNLATLTRWQLDWQAGAFYQLWSINKEDVGSVSDIAWSPDGRYIATANGVPSTQPEPPRLPGLVAIYSAADGALLATLAGHTEEVVGVAWSPDGRRLASFGKDLTLRIWRAPQDR